MKATERTLNQKLEAIAREHLFVETLETRRTNEDFSEVSVWCIKDALEAAYNLGRAEAEK